jgi:hypothetical protein
LWRALSPQNPAIALFSVSALTPPTFFVWVFFLQLQGVAHSVGWFFKQFNERFFTNKTLPQNNTNFGFETHGLK